jgi:iron(III) transport system substrate-binding protein
MMKMIIQIVRKFNIMPYLSILLSFVLSGFGALAVADLYAGESVVVYSGRAERLIKPVLDHFEKTTGTTVQLLTAGSTELVNRLRAEGARTPADVFIANEAGALELARGLHLLQPITLPAVATTIPAPFRAPDNSWIGLSGRIWMIVYNTNLVDPSTIHSLLDLATPSWIGMLAIPSANSEYLQDGASIILAAKGKKQAEAFLQGIRDNAGHEVYGKTRQIVDAVAKGKVAVGIVNHYYIFRHLANDPQAPIAPLITDQADGAMGAIMNVAGIGLTAHTAHVSAANQLIEFLMSPTGQKMFAHINKEYPVNAEVKADPELPPSSSFRTSTIPLIRLAELREPIIQEIQSLGLR